MSREYDKEKRRSEASGPFPLLSCCFCPRRADPRSIGLRPLRLYGGSWQSRSDSCRVEGSHAGPGSHGDRQGHTQPTVQAGGRNAPHSHQPDAPGGSECGARAAEGRSGRADVAGWSTSWAGRVLVDGHPRGVGMAAHPISETAQGCTGGPRRGVGTPIATPPVRRRAALGPLRGGDLVRRAALCSTTDSGRPCAAPAL